jgi:hypothetical protein
MPVEGGRCIQSPRGCLASRAVFTGFTDTNSALAISYWEPILERASSALCSCSLSSTNARVSGYSGANYLPAK